MTPPSTHLQPLRDAPVGTGSSGTSSFSLGEILIDIGVILPEQLQQALATVNGSERDLGKALVDLNFTTEEKIMKGLGIKAKVPYFTSLDGLYSQESANILSEELARRLQVVPLFKIDNVVTVAMVNPLDVFIIDTLVKTLGYRIEPVACMRTTIFETINKLYGGLEAAHPMNFDSQAPMRPAGNTMPTAFNVPGITPPPTMPERTASMPPTPSAPGQVQKEEAAFKALLTEIKTKMPESKPAQVDVYRKTLEKNSEDMPIVQLVDAVFKQAVTKKASDIHIEPYEDRTEIRFRIDGVLHAIMSVPKEFESALTARIKVMANLDITETRQPQDGRVVTEVQGRPVDLRISTLPIIYGEKTVVRILDKGSMEFNLKRLGFNKASEDIFKEVLDKPNGIILVTGPTGSGKSTTLYTGLTILNSVDRNIVTLEDPVEYHLRGINQVQVNTKVGLTFAKGLRSILRQDPDVIMVGEIRDEETAEIAIQSALTGHLVLSTLHTNDAPGAITRLINMGVEPFLISASVLMIIAQRLMRVLCPNCKEAHQPPEAIVNKLKKNAPSFTGAPTFYKARGCDQCHATGYRGRRGIYEILKMSLALREATINNLPLDEMRAVAIKEGMHTLLEEGAVAALSGNTTLEEMMRVCAQEE